MRPVPLCTGPPGYIGLRNKFLGSLTFRNTGSVTCRKNVKKKAQPRQEILHCLILICYLNIFIFDDGPRFYKQQLEAFLYLTIPISYELQMNVTNLVSQRNIQERMHKNQWIFNIYLLYGTSGFLL
jgi:hypothetical protein